MAKRILIVGGVAGGASAAARLRRLDENAAIVLFERGPDVSFANCGLPYYLGREIKERGKLLVQTPQKLAANLNLDVRVRSKVIAILRDKKVIQIRNLETNVIYEEAYDTLILAPGAAPIIPLIPGIEKPGIFSLRNLVDTDRIHNWVQNQQARKAVVVGAGFIGLEMAEQLKIRGLEVALIQRSGQVLDPFDPEMITPIHQELVAKGIDLRLNHQVVRFEDASSKDKALHVVLDDGSSIEADVVIMGIGVKPESHLASDAKLEVNARGAIKVNDFLCTSDPCIYAIGDAIEVTDPITGNQTQVPLAGPANRQGRVVADNIAGKPTRYRGTLGTAILRIFDYTTACTGANAKTLSKAGITFKTVYLHPNSHAGYYPGAHPISLKVLFSPTDGKILGAQAVGKDGVDKRIDVIATSIHHGGTMDDLVDYELCYAPPFGSAKDPVNLAGMVIQNNINHLVEIIHWSEVEARVQQGAKMLDVREPKEVEAGMILGAVNIPLGQLRDRLTEIDLSSDWIVYCQSGQRSYNACRILSQHGYKCCNLSGAYKTYSAAKSISK